jgi:hypothetical protein
MDLSGAFTRWVAARPVALLLVVALVSGGLSACGSSSSTSTKESSQVVKKQAGLTKDVELTVFNKSTGSVNVWVCDPTGGCPEFKGYSLVPGKTAYRTASTVTGEVAYHPPSRPNWTYFFRFRAENPTVGRPFIRLEPQHGTGTNQEYSLSEGTLVGCLGPNNPPGCGKLGGDATGVGFFDLVLYRDADTSRVKKLSITIVKVPVPPACQPQESQAVCLRSGARS